MERREFFQSLIAGGATIRKTRKHVRHTDDVRLYHGPMTIPAHVAQAVREEPLPHKASGGGHLVLRYQEADGTVYVFRSRIPDSRLMVGEIVRTPIGRLRVHCWTAARIEDRVPDVPLVIVERKEARQAPSHEPNEDISTGEPTGFDRLIAEAWGEELPMPLPATPIIPPEWRNS